ncbi:hypothetical protein BKA00_006155 [Actinomadura coerulea]|uniref:Uncharacterized protein n=1 Tax=Actinomadura coerulea TaxID=46159 RepID=A0A7X0L208_9ACTN|nr:hypothetical protein [Actinomadura coerulea]MBB6399241.1 hypothetical protein [Actinomadura coerulea]GGQ24338.1 hypothetical protein GCM10010187_46160 [Actinomadura coerulea]
MARPRRSAWLAVLVTCCLIGVWSFVSKGRDAKERDEARARAALVSYLDLVRDRDWIKACAMQDDSSRDSDCEEFLSSGPRLVAFDVGGARSTSWNTEGTFIRFPVSLIYAGGGHEFIELEVGSKADGYADTIVDRPSSHTLERPYDG